MAKTWLHKAVDNGRELQISFSERGDTWRGLLSREFLDDEVGDEATENDRLAWLEKHNDQVFAALKAKFEGRMVTSPFDRVIFTEKT